MSKKSDSIWLIILIILFIFVLIIGLSHINNDDFETDEDELKRRKEEEDRLLKEIEALEKRNEIFENHKFTLEFTDGYLERLCEKRYNQLIRSSLIVAIIINLLIVLLIPSITLLDIVSWYGIAVLIFNILLALIFVKIKKGKEKIKDYIELTIESRIYRNKDTKYYSEKIGYYQNELDRIQNSIISKKSGAIEYFKGHNSTVNILSKHLFTFARICIKLNP